MTELIRTTLRDSKTARWVALAIMTFAMFAGYLFTEILSPLKTYTENSLGWDGSDYGIVTSAYGWFNVFFGLLLLGGILLDKLGVRFSTVSSAVLMIVGAAVKYWAFVTNFAPDTQILGMSLSVFYAAMGYAIFGVGAEYAGITVTKALVKWFKGKEIALAMGLQVSFSRLGSFLALSIAPHIVEKYSLSTPFLIGVLLLIIGLICFFAYNVYDKKLDLEISKTVDSSDEEFKMSDLKYIFSNRGFWYIAILCLLFYSAVFPFYKYGPDLMIQKFGVSAKWSGLVPSLVPLGSILLTPVFGSMYDKRGKGASIMILGALLLILVHLILYFPFVNNVYIAAVAVIFLGIAFSLVPSAMWPSVPKIIPEQRLGSAYALIFYVQNWGLMGVPLLLGYTLDRTNPQVTTQIKQLRLQFESEGLSNDAVAEQIMNLKEAGTIPSYDYSTTWLIFIGLALSAIVFAFLLKREDKIKGYGLELPNENKIVNSELLT